MSIFAGDLIAGKDVHGDVHSSPGAYQAASRQSAMSGPGEKFAAARGGSRRPERKIGSARESAGWGASSAPSNSVVKFPSRSGLTFLSEAIPLFYIGQNRDGFWVARGAEGRNGGVFFFKASAIRFARNKSAPAGCALMFISAPVELDCDNEGSQIVEILHAAIGVMRRRAPTLVSFLEMAIAEWRKLLAELSRAGAGKQRHRAAVERELFRGQYRLASKNDDDLLPQCRDAGHAKTKN